MENKNYTITFKDDIAIYRWEDLLERNKEYIPVDYGHIKLRIDKKIIKLNGLTITRIDKIIIDADKVDGIVTLIFLGIEDTEICRRVMKCDESFVMDCNGYLPEYRFEVTA